MSENFPVTESTPQAATAVGVIGLGIIGSRVAKTLRDAGHEVFVYNRSPRPEPNFLGSPSEVAENCPVIQLFIRNSEDLTSVAEQLAGGGTLSSHHTIINHATVSPDAVEEAQDILTRQGAGFVNAPFMGSRDAGAAGKLIYYVGGEEDLIERVRPVLEISSQEIIDLGTPAEAAVTKIAANLLVAVQNQAIAESIGLAARYGVDPEKFVKAVGATGVAGGLFHMKAPTMISGRFEPHFTAANMLKDARLADALAKILGQSSPSLDVARAGLEQIVEAGHAEEDFAAVARLFLPQQHS